MATPPKQEQTSDRPLTWVVAVCSIIIGVGWNLFLSKDTSVQHLGRVIGVILTVDIGLLIGLSPSKLKGWTLRQRIAAIVICAGASFAAWWFIPTSGGTNLWSAVSVSRSLDQQFQSLPSEAVSRAQSLTEDAAFVTAQFPRLGYRWEKSRQAWCERASGHFVSDLKTISIGDLATFQAESGDRKRLKQLCPEARQPIERAEAHWLRETVDNTIASAEELVKSHPQAAVALLREFSARLTKVETPDSMEAALMQTRKRAMEAVLDGIREQATALIEAKSYEEAVIVVDGLDELLLDEVRQTGFSEELHSLMNGYRYLSKLRQIPASKE